MPYPISFTLFTFIMILSRLIFREGCFRGGWRLQCSDRIKLRRTLHGGLTRDIFHILVVKGVGGGGSITDFISYTIRGCHSPVVSMSANGAAHHCTIVSATKQVI